MDTRYNNSIYFFLMHMGIVLQLPYKRLLLFILWQICATGFAQGQDANVNVQSLSPVCYFKEISSNGKLLATIDGQLIDAKNGCLCYKVPDSLWADLNSLLYLIDDRHVLVTNNSTGKVVIIDFISKKVKKVLGSNPSRPIHISISNQRDYMIAYSDPDWPIQDFTDSTNNARIIKDQKEGAFLVFSLPDGHYISAINSDFFHIYKMVSNTQNVIVVGLGHQGYVAKMFDRASGKEVWKQVLPKGFNLNNSSFISVEPLSMSTSGSYIVCNGTVKETEYRFLILNAKTGAMVENLDIPGIAILSPDDSNVLVLNWHQRESIFTFDLKLINFRTKKSIANLQLTGNRNLGISISPDFKEAVVPATTIDKLQIIDLLTLKPKTEIKAPLGYYCLVPQQEFKAVLYTPDNEHMIHSYRSEQNGMTIIGFWNRKMQKITKKIAIRSKPFHLLTNFSYYPLLSKFILSDQINLYSINFRQGFKYNKLYLNNQYSYKASANLKLIGGLTNTNGGWGLFVDSLESGKRILTKENKSKDVVYSLLGFDPKNKYFAFYVFYLVNPAENDMKIIDLQRGKEILSLAKVLGVSQYSSNLSLFWDKEGESIFVIINQKEIKNSKKLCSFLESDLNSTAKVIVKINVKTGAIASCYQMPSPSPFISVSENYIAFINSDYESEKQEDILTILNHNLQLIGQYPLPRFRGTSYNICFYTPDDYLLIMPTPVLPGENNPELTTWVFDLKNGRFVRQFNYPFPVDFFMLSYIDKNVLINILSLRGMINFYDLRQEKPLLTWQMFGLEDFVMTTPENYYYASKGAMNALRFEKDNVSLPFRQYDLIYNRPDKVLEKIPHADPIVLELYRKAWQKRLQKTGFKEGDLSADADMPLLRILTNDLPFEAQQTSLSIALEAEDMKYNLDRINVWINDVPVFGRKGISLREKALKKWKGTLTLPLNTGENQVQISCLNEKGVESLLSELSITCTKEGPKPDLYLVSIGASEYLSKNMNLTYAAKDATDLAALFQSKNEQFAHVYTKTLLNQEVTLNNVLSLRTWLNQSKTDDRVILFIAGHGLLDQNFDYYLAGYEVDFVNPEKKGIPYDVLESLLDSIPARQKLMLLDACHSGELDKENVTLGREQTVSDGKVKFRAFKTNISEKKVGLQNSFELMKEMFVDLRRGSGTAVISSASGTEYSIEGDAWRNGVFTYSLIKGLRDKEADLDKDGEITISELQGFLGQRVSDLTQGQQRPTFRVENMGNDWRIW